MFEELEDFLRKVVSPERTAVVVDACQAIADLGLCGHVDDFNDILSVANDTDIATTVQRIDNTLVATLESCLNQFGVFTTGDHNVKISAGILRGLHLIPNYVDTETIEAFCESDDAPEQKLANMLELVTEYTWGDYVSNLERVNPSLITRINENLQHEPDPFVERDPMDHIKFRLRALLAQQPDLLIVESLGLGYKLGLPIDPAIEPYKTYVANIITVQGALPQTPDQAAAELLAYVLASETPDQLLQKTAQDELENVFTDINFITKTSAAMDRWFNAIGGLTQ